MRTILVFLWLAAGMAGQPGSSAPETVRWSNAMRQPAAWYGTPEATRIADNLLLYQFDNGGWDKNIDRAAPLDAAQKEQLLREKGTPLGRTTIDNGATYTEMQYLAKVHAATREKRFAESFLRGLQYLFAAQYANGGWPQYFPLRDGYWSRITYNDNAMVGVLKLLQSVSGGEGDYRFVSQADRRRAGAAVEEGLECILKSQVLRAGRLTVWCAQHDERTLAPALGRSYELPSLSGSESVGVVRFLMSIEPPSSGIVRSVESAVAWFNAVKISGFRYRDVPAPGMPGGTDRLLIPDAEAPPLWARFYETGTDRPIFSGRDGILKYAVTEIEHERRTGYGWYGTWAAALLSEEYPKWMKKWAEGANLR